MCSPCGTTEPARDVRGLLVEPVETPLVLDQQSGSISNLGSTGNRSREGIAGAPAALNLT